MKLTEPLIDVLIFLSHSILFSVLFIFSKLYTRTILLGVNREKEAKELMSTSSGESYISIEIELKFLRISLPTSKRKNCSCA